MNNSIESITYNFEDDKNKDFYNSVSKMFENQYKYEKEHPEEMAEAEEYLATASMKESMEWLARKLRLHLFVPTPRPDDKPIECEVRCRGCKNVEECSYIRHPEILVSRIIDESTNRYTCYEEKEDD